MIIRNIITSLAATYCVAIAPLPARAWWDEGHMQVAAVAYTKLTDTSKNRADVLLRLNPDYAKWTAGAPDETTARNWAFVHAATWPDDIKTKPYGYTRDKVTDPTAGQNIGYGDRIRHDYWHYKDVGYSPDGTPVPHPDAVDAVTQLRLMIAVLPATSSASDELRSYDLAWVLHIVGDIHQPLHAVARFTKQIPTGDQGGNAELVIPATGEIVTLHAYWDRTFGGYSSAFGAILDATSQDGIASIIPNPVVAQALDPDIWVTESAALAQKYGYAAPVSSGPNATLLTREYETNARNIARSQAALAAARLANLLNAAFQ